MLIPTSGSIDVHLTTQKASGALGSARITLPTQVGEAKYTLHADDNQLDITFLDNSSGTGTEPVVSIAEKSTDTVYVGSSGATAEYVITSNPASD